MGISKVLSIPEGILFKMIKMAKRIIFVNGHMNVGGVEKTLLDLLTSLDPARYEVDLLLLEQAGDYKQAIPAHVHVKELNVSETYGPFYSTLWKLCKRLQFKLMAYRILLTFACLMGKKVLVALRPLFQLNNRYDYAIAYRPGGSADIVAYTLRSDRKLLWWHHGECNYSVAEVEAVLPVWKHFNHIISVSEACKKMLQRSFPPLADKMEKMHNMIKPKCLQYLAGTDNPYSHSEDTFVLITVGRLYIEKHIENVVDAAQMLQSKGCDNFCWYIVGDGDLYDDIQAKIHAAQLEDKVVLLGAKVNPYPYIKYADVLVHTSYVEAQCTTVLEAMSLGTPCVMTRTTNPQDFTEDGVNCILVERNITSLTEAVLMLYSDRNLQEELVGHARKTVNSYSPENVVRRFEELLK